MPNLSGMELARKILQIRPSFPIILLSGYLEADIPNELRGIGIRTFLTKPVELAALSRVVHEALLSAEGGLRENDTSGG